MNRVSCSFSWRPLRWFKDNFLLRRNVGTSARHLGLLSSSIKVGGIVCFSGAVLYCGSDSFKHVVRGAERVGIVTVATIQCFSYYKKTLDTEYPSEIERAQALSITHKKAAQVTLKALEANGGVYIKLGQHITALTYLLPPEWTDTMLPLQDRCPQSKIEEISAMFEKDLGKSLTDVFSDFNPIPVGVASLAQVHVGTLRESGKRVAVKVQHPSLSEFVPLDVYITKTVFNLMLKVFPEYPLIWLGEEMQNSIFVEMDFKNEARNATRTAALFERYKKDTALRIPYVLETHARILIMEYLPGARLDNLAYMKQHDINRAQVSTCLSNMFNRMIFAPGVGLHCDPHGGNLAIVAADPRLLGNGHNFEIILYDHGLYRDIPLQMKRDYAKFWLAILDGNITRMRKYTRRFTGIADEQQFRIFLSAITGRTPEAAFNKITEPRSKLEMLLIQNQLGSDGGILQDLMHILSTMPRVVLLILKTNDLTRNLNEGLGDPLGLKRTFLILAQYCARAVYEENVDLIATHFENAPLKRSFHILKSWLAYTGRIISLRLYDSAISVLNRVHHVFISA